MLNNNSYFELQTWQSGNILLGVDEVGRGCLFGPLVTCAVALDPYKTHNLLKDSKLLSPIELISACNWIVSNGKISISIVHNRLIDRLNIYLATQFAMKKAINQLILSPIQPHLILIDAMPLEIPGHTVRYFPKGESKSISIAAASIVAKVTRDAIISRLSAIFPDYGLETHKGYGTQDHIAKIDIFGKSILHRDSFLNNYNYEKHTSHQQTIF